MSVPRIHFVSLISIDFDVDLLPYFIPHYAEIECDNYCVFLHEGKNTDANLWAEGAAREAGWKARFIPREASFGGGELRRALFEKFRRAIKPEDYIICADADEFQVWKDSPKEIAESGYDIVLGRRIDRFNEKLCDIDFSLDLETNFPMENENLWKMIFPRKSRSRDKIVMSKASCPVDFKKSLGLSVRQVGNLKVTGDIPINHYKWRKNIFDRLRQRSDYTTDEVTAIKKFFS